MADEVQASFLEAIVFELLPKQPDIGQMMTRKPVCAPARATIREVACLLDENHISGMPVVDDAGRMIGVVSRSDLTRRCADNGAAPQFVCETMTAPPERPAAELMIAADIMSPTPITAKEHEGMRAVAQRMCENRVHRLIIVNDVLEPMGVLTSLDLVRYVSELWKKSDRAECSSGTRA